MSNLSDVLRPTPEHLSSGRLHGVLIERIAPDGEIAREARLSHLCNHDTIPLFVLTGDPASYPRAAWHGSIGALREALEPGWGETQALFAHFAGQVIDRLARFSEIRVPELYLTQAVSLEVDWKPFPITGDNFSVAILNVETTIGIHFAWDLVGTFMEPEKQDDPMVGIELMRRDGAQNTPVFFALEGGEIDDLIAQLRLGLCGQAKPVAT